VETGGITLHLIIKKLYILKTNKIYNSAGSRVKNILWWGTIFKWRLTYYWGEGEHINIIK